MQYNNIICSDDIIVCTVNIIIQWRQKKIESGGVHLSKVFTSKDKVFGSIILQKSGGGEGGSGPPDSPLPRSDAYVIYCDYIQQ